MARGLSREQSKAKNDKKNAGGNKGNTEGLTPQQRAERCVRERASGGNGSDPATPSPHPRRNLSFKQTCSTLGGPPHKKKK